MTGETILAITGGVIVVITLVVILIKSLPKKPNQKKFAQEWRALQKNCRDSNTWPLAIIEADRLLHKALRLRRFKGKTIGERLVSAQDKFGNNDGIWFAHNLFKKVSADPAMKLSEDETKKALAEFRRALRDLGALPND